MTLLRSFCSEGPECGEDFREHEPLARMHGDRFLCNVDYKLKEPFMLLVSDEAVSELHSSSDVSTMRTAKAQRPILLLRRKCS